MSRARCSCVCRSSRPPTGDDLVHGSDDLRRHRLLWHAAGSVRSSTRVAGYGGNPGHPSERGLLADAQAARAYLASREDVDPDRIVYFGESLGAAVAVALAAEQPPAALVLRSPFTSLADVGRVHYPLLPARLLLRDRYAAIDQIGHVTAPLLVVAGARDEVIPVAQSRRVYEAAVGPKRWVLIPGVDHNQVEFLAGEQFIREIVAFLAEHAG